MVKQLEGLLHTRDLTIREADFVASLVREREADPPPPLPKPRTVWPTDSVPTEPQAPRESKAAMRRRKQIERGVIKL